MPPLADPQSKRDQLELKLGANWEPIRHARERTKELRNQLDELFASQGSPDVSLVVFGSVARNEVTSNTTRRVLLLLESLPIGPREAFDRVRRQIIRRYLNDHRGLTHAGREKRVPRFLLNDLTRYWRTVTVDFVYKQRAARDRKWALRNAKLRMSRKLIFAAGLAHVFNCHFDNAAEGARLELQTRRSVAPLTAYLEERLARTPLEAIAGLCVDLDVPGVTANRVFDNYDRFLGIIDDPAKRESLELAGTRLDLRDSGLWGEIRDISQAFHQGLVSLFFVDNANLSELSKEYGVF